MVHTLLLRVRIKNFRLGVGVKGCSHSNWLASRGCRAAQVLLFSLCLASSSPLIANEANEALAKARASQGRGFGAPSAFFFRAQPGKSTSKVYYENRSEHLRDPSTQNPKTEFQLSGESLKPGLLVNHNSFGLGLYANLGSHRLKNMSETNFTESLVRHRGLGLELSYLPGSGTKRNLGIYIRGGLLHANQEVTADSLVEDRGELFKTDYLVFEREVGIHYRINLTSFLFLYPWTSLQARSLKTHSLDTGSHKMKTDSQAYADAKSLWGVPPEFRYGVDIALKVYAFDLHMGQGISQLIDLGKPATTRELTKIEVLV